jgi:Flp pilus assembly pilin Flp
MDTRSEQGQTTGEYAVVLTVIAAGAVATVALLSGSVGALFQAALARLA